MHDTIKVEKINPNGSSTDESVFRAGVHIKTKIYIDPSNRLLMMPHKKISLERIVTVYAFLSPSYQWFDFAVLLSSDPDDCSP
mmetsp:Transcript_30092/g.45871  ORF Transcript_30092/g.45871 Transcript_30092/m.45871 type:complete len:83 (-) Transcript_30092:909-1157(-)